jgi:hypothetical protein
MDTRRTHALFGPLALASTLLLAGCRTDEEPVDNDVDTGADGSDDITGCGTDNPSETCRERGCPASQRCVETEGGCVPSHCTCEDSGWMCTADCGPDFACVPDDRGFSPGPTIDLTRDCAAFDSDPLTTQLVELDGDALRVDVSYGGGCKEHLFRVCWDGSFMESNPVQVALALQHESNDDPCDAALSSSLRIPLTPLRVAYAAGYGSDTGTMVVRLGEASATWNFDACTGVELPACPPVCEDGAFSRCGTACDAATDAACGNDIGDGMQCVGGSWQCTVHPPLGPGCNAICRR